MGVAIRELRIGDRLSVEELLDVVDPGWTDRLAPGTAGTIAFLADNGTFVYGAYVNNKPAGWAWGDRTRYPTGEETAQLKWLEVAEPYRGQGLGSMLMQSAIEHARREGHRRLWVTAPANNHDALRLYERLGGDTNEHGYTNYWWPLS